MAKEQGGGCSKTQHKKNFAVASRTTRLNKERRAETQKRKLERLKAKQKKRIEKLKRLLAQKGIE